MKAYITEMGTIIYLSDVTYNLLPKSERSKYKKYVKVKEPAEVSYGTKPIHQEVTNNRAVTSGPANQERIGQTNTGRATKRGRKPRL